MERQIPLGGRIETQETVSNSAYAYDPVAQTQTVAYGAATAINTYPSVGGQAIAYIDANSQSRGLHSTGNLHSDGQGWCGLRAPVHHPPILPPFNSVFSPF